MEIALLEFLFPLENFHICLIYLIEKELNPLILTVTNFKNLVLLFRVFVTNYIIMHFIEEILGKTHCKNNKNHVNV